MRDDGAPVRVVLLGPRPLHLRTVPCASAQRYRFLSDRIAVPTHYEERLQKDLDWIQDLVGIVGLAITKAIDDAVSSVLNHDKDLAALTVIGDYTINRQTRELDRLCHAFVARHLPGAGHLRYVSAVLRLNIALERMGDYAATISRTAAQLSSKPPAVVARDIETMSEHARRMLNDSLRSFQQRDVGMAQATLAAAAQFAQYFDRVFADLVKEGEAHSRPINDLFSLMARSTWIETVEELDRLLPPYDSWKHRLGRFARFVL